MSARPRRTADQLQAMHATLNAKAQDCNAIIATIKRFPVDLSYISIWQRIILDAEALRVSINEAIRQVDTAWLNERQRLREKENADGNP